MHGDSDALELHSAEERSLTLLSIYFAKNMIDLCY